MTTTTLRSTNAIKLFVLASKKLAARELECEQIKREMQRLTPEVLNQIGTVRTTNVPGVGIVTLTPRETKVISMRGDKSVILAFWRERGLRVSKQEPEYVNNSSFRSEVLKGAVPLDLYTVESTFGVNVI